VPVHCRMRAFDRDLICGGHYGQRPVCRANRPNTWLHRPACKREENPCQLGAVHTWHFSDLARCPTWVRKVRQSGHWSGRCHQSQSFGDVGSMSGLPKSGHECEFDPQATQAKLKSPQCKRSPVIGPYAILWVGNTGAARSPPRFRIIQVCPKDLLAAMWHKAGGADKTMRARSWT
jgi:hypothetical protein